MRKDISFEDKERIIEWISSDVVVQDLIEVRQKVYERMPVRYLFDAESNTMTAVVDKESEGLIEKIQVLIDNRIKELSGAYGL